MQMKVEHFDRLIELSSREGLPLRTYLIMARRSLRHVIAEDDMERARARLGIRALKRGLPFTQRSLEGYQEACENLRKQNREVLVIFGQYLREHHLAIEDELGWEGLCDVLCVNPTHRAEAGTHDKGLFGITWIGGQFEDSASHYGSDRSGEGPITRAVGAAMQDWMLKNMDKLPDPCAPGGPLHGLPTYYPQPDGTMARKSASLVVHDADGSSRVVERKVEKLK